MPEPVAPSSTVPELLREIRERALAGSVPWSALLDASRETAAIIAAGQVSTGAAEMFLLDTAAAMGLDPNSQRVRWTIARGLRVRAGLPVVTVNDGRHLREWSEDALAAVRAGNAHKPRVFTRGGELVRVKRTDEGRWMVDRPTEHGLRGELERAADFVNPPKEEGEEPFPVAPPMDVVRDVRSLPEFPGIPPLDGIVTSPRVRPDGTILSRPGYDAGTRLYLVPDAPMVEVPENPSRDNARDAARFIAEELLGDFPFVSPADRANAIAFALSIVARPAIAGAVPVAVFDARSGQGSGKSLLLRTLCYVACGTEPALSAIPGDEAEWRKTITAALLRCGEVFPLDNATETIESGTFANAITSPVFEDRILGASRRVELPVRCCWAITGNRTGFGGDMARRVYPIELDAGCERPEDRDGFRHPDLMEWVRANRPALLRALLIMARAWWVAGCPAPAVKTWGSFESFVRVVGGILEHAGVQGFLANRAEFRDAANESRHEWAAFLAALHVRFGVRPFTTRDVVNEAELLGEFSVTLPSELRDAFERRRGFANRLGIALGKSVGRIMDGFRLEDAGRDSNTKSRRFRVGRAGPGAAPAEGGDSPGGCGVSPILPRVELFSSHGVELSQTPPPPGNGTEGER
ncbi:MAG: hypothetical protein GIKADHBN_03396 [Phycisphaerales bacterium]|nr:hypothetical protein [Phycisphaerales bacterium]